MGENNTLKENKKKPKKKNFWVELFKTKPIAGVSLVILVIFILIAIFADVLAPTKMTVGGLPTSVLEKMQPPSMEHLLGTDTLGRDLLSYMIYGARTSVVLGISCTLIGTVISVIIGVSSAVIGGTFDLVVQRIVDAFNSIPGMLITMILMAALGNGMIQMIIVLSIPGGIGGSRMIRGVAMSVKDAGYCKMSTMLSGGPLWRMIHHVVPNIMPLILMNLAGNIGGIIMAESTLNFLGYGVSLNTPSWGALLSGSGRSNMYSAPWLAIIPGIAIGLIVFASAMFGDGVRDLLDPRLKGGVGSYDKDKIKKQIANKIHADA
ncbi:MAG: ABC transporter permease [Eubacterium sp.]|nr:ABC transporter permease [Eubacterium sp.]